MIISRLEVEEGFLDGIQLDFVPGLNVLIGPRGCGKTSVIELCRFVLGVSAFTDGINAAARRHALAVLGSGQAAVRLSGGGNEMLVTRTAAEEIGRSTSPMPAPPPLILSQNEIELVGLDPIGRLRILDAFWESADDQGPSPRKLPR